MTTYKHTSAKALPILICNYKIYNTTDKIFKEQKSETPIYFLSLLIWSGTIPKCFLCISNSQH